MTQDCIFCKIVEGEIPSYKVYEDDHFLAFLDINPINLGHTLLVPKKHIDYVFDLNDESYCSIWTKAKELAPKIQAATNSKRIGIAVEGFAVPHAHIHLVPINKGNELDPNLAKPADSSKLAKMAAKIRMTNI